MSFCAEKNKLGLTWRTQIVLDRLARSNNYQVLLRVVMKYCGDTVLEVNTFRAKTKAFDGIKSTNKMGQCEAIAKGIFLFGTFVVAVWTK